MEEWIRSKVSAVLLAAGLSRRMGGDKLLLPYMGKPLLARAVELMGALPFHEKILVTTPARLDKIHLPAGVTPVLNLRPELGQGESLRLGTGAATGEHYLFLAADQPLLDAAVLRWLLSHAKKNADKIVYPVVEGKPCNPAIFPALFRAELLSLSGDTGGRAVRLAHPESCLALEAREPAVFLDIDCREDYWNLLRSGRG